MNVKIEAEVLEIRKLIDGIQFKIQINHSEINNLEKYKKQLQLLEKRINYFKQTGEDIRDELKSQKIKLVLKIDEIENTISSTKELHEIGKMLTETFAEFNSNKKTKATKLINHFNGVDEHFTTASKAFKLLKEKISKTDLTELSNIINEVCNLKNEDKIYVLHKRMISVHDFGFHEAFLKIVKEGMLKKVLDFSKTKKSKFSISDMLEYYVNYTLNVKSEV